MVPWGIAVSVAVLAISTESGRTYVKKLVKTGLRASLYAKDTAVELARKAKNYQEDLVAEIKAESAAEENNQAT